MTTASTTMNVEAVLMDMARLRFTDFFRYIRIQDIETGSGVALRFEPWPHLFDIADLFDRQRFIIVIKSRQVGLSWLIAAYALWTALYNQGANVLLLSKGQDEASDLLGKVKFILAQMPPELKAHVGRGGTNNSSEIEFTALYSRIRALPSTPGAGVGNTATLVIQDEADKHEFLEDNFAVIRPTVDAPGSKAKHIIVSALYPDKIDSFFRQEILRANNVDEHNASVADGRSTYVKKFLSVWVRPGRDEEWYKSARAGYADEHAFQMQYPRTLEEAMAPPDSQLAFRREVLDEWMAESSPPLNIPGAPADAGIWRPYSVGKKYAAFTDTSHGTGNDFAVTIVMEADTGVVAADVYSNLLDPDDLAFQSVRLLEMYDNPIWGIEDNDWGIQVIKKAQQMGYRRLFHRPFSEKQPHVRGRVGWHTDETRRRSLYGDLQQAVKDRAVTVFRREGIQQFYQTIRNPKKNGRVEAIEGGHDDYPLAVGGALQMVPHARRSRAASMGSPHLAREPVASARRAPAYTPQW